MAGKQKYLTHTIGDLVDKDTELEFVSAEEPIEKAITIMTANNYSQLPVAKTPKKPGIIRTVKGYVCWKSVSEAFAFGRTVKQVKDCMIKTTPIVEHDEPLTKVLKSIGKKGFVLVRAEDHSLCGIVTLYDISLRFRDIGEPFILIEEIEKNLRRVISKYLSTEQICAGLQEHEKDNAISICDGTEVVDTDMLGIGNYCRLLQNPENWEKLPKNLLSRKLMCEYLERVRVIRNKIMHFRSGLLSDREVNFIRNFRDILIKIDS